MAHSRRFSRVAVVAALATTISLGGGHAAAVPAASSQQVVQDVVKQLTSAMPAREAVDPADPRTWPVELIAAGVGLAALLAVIAVSGAGSSEDGEEAADPDASSSENLDAELTEAIVGSSRLGSSQPEVFGSSVNGIGLVGSSDFSLPDLALDLDWDGPPAFDDSITTPEILDSGTLDFREASAANQGYERWVVASPAMGRNVELQVLPARNPDAAAPILMLLDGVNAPSNSGWINRGLKSYLDNDNVTVILPSHARGSFYVDWVNDDPVLGRSQWETFLTQELPPLLESSEEINHNGRYAIGGLSMGATGAVVLASANPELFDATFGISGCYSLTSEVGYQTARLSVESRGGDVENMLGPVGSPTRERYDVTADPSNLRDMSVYLTAAEGEFQEDADPSGSSTAALGIALEQGSFLCTQDLEKAMQDAGMDHQLVEYRRVGVHDWDNFRSQFEPAWNHIKPALY